MAPLPSITSLRQMISDILEKKENNKFQFITRIIVKIVQNFCNLTDYISLMFFKIPIMEIFTVITLYIVEIL